MTTMTTNLTQKEEISKHFLIKTNNLPLVEKLWMLTRYLGEDELAKDIKNYINMEETYKKMGDELLQAGLKIPSSKDFVSFFKNKVLEIYNNDCYPQEGFITWLNN